MEEVVKRWKYRLSKGNKISAGYMGPKSVLWNTTFIKVSFSRRSNKNRREYLMPNCVGLPYMFETTVSSLLFCRNLVLIKLFISRVMPLVRFGAKTSFLVNLICSIEEETESDKVKLNLPIMNVNILKVARSLDVLHILVWNVLINRVPLKQTDISKLIALFGFMD